MKSTVFAAWNSQSPCTAIWAQRHATGNMDIICEDNQIINKKEYLTDTLTSIFAQTYTRWTFLCKFAELNKEALS